MKWFAAAVNRWDSETPNLPVLTLALNICVFLSSDEENFLALTNTEMIDNFIKELKLILQQMGTTPDVGYVKLISCFLKHTSGCAWIMTTNYWLEIFDLTLGAQDGSHLKREGTKFICNLIVQLVTNKSTLAPKIISVLITPILDTAGLLRNNGNVNEVCLNMNCVQNVEIFLEVLETMLHTKNLAVFREVLKITDKYNYMDQSMKILIELPEEKLFLNLARTLICLFFFKFAGKSENLKTIRYEELLAIMGKNLHYSNGVMYENINIYSALAYWRLKYSSKLRNQLPKIVIGENHVISAEDTLILIQVFPACSVSWRLLGADHATGSNDDFRERHASANCKRMLPIAYHIFYKLLNVFEERLSFEYAAVSLQYIIKSKNYYNHNQANILLGVLIYCFEDLGRLLLGNSDLVKSSEIYLESLLETIRVLIVAFDLNWQDTVEVMVIMEIALCIFTKWKWSPQVS